MSKTQERADRLLKFLRAQEENRGTMADLRCGFSPAREHRTWSHIAPFCQLDRDWSRIPVQTVCAAFATQPKSSSSGNLGTTLRLIATGKNKDGMQSFEGRFRRLLTCSSMLELCKMLPAVIRAAKAKDVPINHSQLYCDICWWESSDIKIRWAADFWGQPEGSE